MGLREVLQQSEFSGLTDQQALDYGNATVVIGGTDERWTYSGVQDLFGVVIAEKLGNAIRATQVDTDVYLEFGADTYVSPGIQLSLTRVQDLLSLIGANKPDLAGVCSDLKEIGITHGTRWQGWGIDQPVLADITDAMNRNQVAQWWANITYEIVPPLLSSGATVEQIKTAIAGA